MSTAPKRVIPPFAPWAEAVPGEPPATVDTLLEWPDDNGYRFEVVEGALVRMAGTRPQAGRVTRRLFRALDSYVETHSLGTVTLPDEVYDLEKTGQRDTGLLPDLGFYPSARDKLVEPHRPLPFAPDLAVGVAGPSQRQANLDAQARRYLAAGTTLVWVIWPDGQRVDIWRRDEDALVAVLSAGNALDGLDVVPSFTYPVSDLFD